jgi:hypothetical protein
LSFNKFLHFLAKHWKTCFSLYERGFIDSETSIEFDRRVRDFKPTWDCLVPGFHTWFVAYEADLFKSYLIKEVTDLAHVCGSKHAYLVESSSNYLKVHTTHFRKQLFQCPAVELQ